MIIMYPLTIQLDYTELRYSLRSIEKYLKNITEVIIVTNDLPDWLVNVTQINLPDIKGKKQWSIRRKILAALEYAEEILFMNDDVYLLRPQNNFPYYYHGDLKGYKETGSKPLLEQLIKMDSPTKHYDGHFPIMYIARFFKEVSEWFTDDCIIKSMYCNSVGIEGTFISDCKLLRAMKPEDIRVFIKDKHCFSTGNYSLSTALSILEELFPEPSKYEI